MGWRRYNRETLKQWKIKHSPTAIGTPQALFAKTPEELQRIHNSIHVKRRPKGRWVKIDLL